jgi:hypothetical protein
MPTKAIRGASAMPHLGGSLPLTDRSEPSADDLAAIEAEWPLIEADLALLDAEIRVLTAVGGPSALDWRRLRRAQARVLAEAAAFASRLVTGRAGQVAA